MKGPSQRWPVGITVHDRDPPSPTEGGQKRLAEPDYVRPSVVDLTRAEMQPFDWRSTKEMLETITVHLTKEEARNAKELARWREKADEAATYRSVIEFYREESEAACARLKSSDADPTQDEVIENEMLAMKLRWAAQAIEAGPVGEVHDKVAAVAARSDGQYDEGQPVRSRSAASFADQARRFDNLASRIDAAPSWERVYDEMHDALSKARRKLPVLPETSLAQPFTPTMLSRILVELSDVTVPILSIPEAGEELMRAAQSRVVQHSALVSAGNKSSDWKVEYERRRRRHARRAYVKNPASLPDPVRTYLERVWRWEADASIATMGAPPSGHVWTIDPLNDQIDILLELPSSDLVGWQWGDLYTLVISIPRNDLVAGRYDRLTAEVSNG